MRFLNWYFLMGLSLVAASAVIYFIHFLIFRDPKHIFVFFLSDVAFLPFEVLVVTLIIHRLLSEREKRLMLKKLNMVIGAFFSEVGINLLKHLSFFDSQSDQIRRTIIFKYGSAQELSMAADFFKQYHSSIDSRKSKLWDLRGFLKGKRNFLLRLMENPNLLEHQSFSDLLLAVFHLTEELEYRPSVADLPEADYRHLSEDMTRAYTTLIAEWIKYMKHLRDYYPYLFSLAIRINPFDPDASAEIK